MAEILNARRHKAISCLHCGEETVWSNPPMLLVVPPGGHELKGGALAHTPTRPQERTVSEWRPSTSRRTGRPALEKVIRASFFFLLFNRFTVGSFWKKRFGQLICRNSGCSRRYPLGPHAPERKSPVSRQCRRGQWHCDGRRTSFQSFLLANAMPAAHSRPLSQQPARHQQLEDGGCCYLSLHHREDSGRWLLPCQTHAPAASPSVRTAHDKGPFPAEGEQAAEQGLC